MGTEVVWPLSRLLILAFAALGFRLVTLCSDAQSTKSLPLKMMPQNCSEPLRMLGPHEDMLPCEEVNALLTFLNYTEGYFPEKPSANQSYCQNQDTSFATCTCNSSYVPSCHITEITLTGASITGTIHGDLANLKELTTLDLSKNQLHGSIPDSLGSLPMLKRLDLSYNKLTGEIPPCLGNLPMLISLDLGYNFLNGTIPRSLGKLSSLQSLFIWYNCLSGPIPEELGNITELQTLNIMENQLTGPLPKSLRNLTKLQEIVFASNKNITGELPDTFHNLTSLQRLDAIGNNLSGGIPAYIRNWTNLIYLYLVGNNFSSIAPEIFHMENLQYLLVSDVSQMAFDFPDLSRMTSLTSLVLRNCSIFGSIPPTIAQLPNLIYLDLSFNYLFGKIPQEMGRLTEVTMLFTENQLEGPIPSGLLSSNQIPRDFTYNRIQPPLEGPIDDNNNYTFRTITSMPNRHTIKRLGKQKCGKRKKYHSLYINCGGKEEKIETIEGEKLYKADNSTANFYVSDSWAYSCSGDFLAISINSSLLIQNTTCGVSVTDAPLYKEARLCPISLRYYGFCLHKGSYNVSLHFIESIFKEMSDHSSLGKRVFDVYVQKQRVLKDFNIRENLNQPENISVMSFNDTAVGEDGILEIHFFWAGKGSWVAPVVLNGPLVSAISVTANFSTRMAPWKIAVITVASVLVLTLLLGYILWISGVIGDRELREKSIEIRGRSYTIKQVVDATKNFSPKTEVGKGKFGSVYRAELPNGPVVAVKKLFPLTHQMKEQIESEVFVLKQLNNEHIVELFGGHSSATKDIHLLVYEFMEHKSLSEALFDPNSIVELNWVSRYQIYVGMAKGLNYLHNSRLKIVHRNIKSSNILLDENLKAKISDLGLAKLYEEENPYFAIRAAGTLVYMAPEYATRKAISDKIDVYSFGVVLLEIISGRNNADYKEGQESEFLLDKACVLQMKNRLMDLVDSRLLSDRTYDRRQAQKVLNLAMMCVEQSHTLRPEMSQVVGVLEDEISIEQLSKQISPSD